jgi:N-acetylneuraminic acid mutarotase
MKIWSKPGGILVTLMAMLAFCACVERSNLPGIPAEQGGSGGGSDSWTALSLTDAPSSRWGHSAIWTGTEMLVWGGGFAESPQQYYNTGGRYDPATDIWTAISETDAPSGRFQHTAIWTGNAMIVWGGFVSNDVGGDTNTGGIYNPETDSWKATAGAAAPLPRAHHSAVWTGTEMIVWGGNDYTIFNPFASGGRYDPEADSWLPVFQDMSGPPTAREGHFAFWSGTEMIIWGGFYQFVIDTGYLNTGARYDPASDSWTYTSVADAPTPRVGFAAVWTGSKMIVWGGFHVDNNVSPGVREYLNSGGSYDPGLDNWKTISVTGAPSPRDSASAVWTGAEMIAWGGFSEDHTVNPAIVNYYNNGARYKPASDTWASLSSQNAPLSSLERSAVWTGKEMIVWGGLNVVYDPDTRAVDYTFLNSGAGYKP